jgi:formate hydrogenlyase subunit 6/NADH:ubiquinone oxidoreductase subunit I
MADFSLTEKLRIPTYDNEEYATTGRVSIDRDRCNGCGLCAKICPGNTLYMAGEGKDRKAYLEVDFPQCMSCNDCRAICERDAITVSVTYSFPFYFKTVAKGALSPPRRF